MQAGCATCRAVGTEAVRKMHVPSMPSAVPDLPLTSTLFMWNRPGCSCFQPLTTLQLFQSPPWNHLSHPGPLRPAKPFLELNSSLPHNHKLPDSSELSRHLHLQASHTYLCVGFCSRLDDVVLEGVECFFPELAEKCEGTSGS